MNTADKLFLLLSLKRPSTYERVALQQSCDEAEIEAMTWLMRLGHRQRDLKQFDDAKRAQTPDRAIPGIEPTPAINDKWNARVDAALHDVASRGEALGTR